jgi:hypothetical protein
MKTTTSLLLQKSPPRGDQSAAPHSPHQLGQGYLGEFIKHFLLLPLIVGMISSAFAQTAVRSSASYSLAAESVEGGGGSSLSANYEHLGSSGLISGLASMGSPVETVKSGYIGQLYEVTTLDITALPTTLNESASQQLNATFTLDDSTIMTGTPFVNWSVVGGPIASISATGLATAAKVYQNTAATVQGSAKGRTATLGLTVLNVGSDDFNTYAGDQIDDDWQVQYFGQPPNPNAGPTIDFDGDGLDNRFEFIAGLIPTSAASRFLLRVENVPGQPHQKNLIFSPRMNGRTYTLQSCLNLADPPLWGTLSATTQSDSGQERTVTDLNATGPSKFYRIQITKP